MIQQSDSGVLHSGVLYIVATPIGNLGDMVPRAIDILQAVDLIAAEDTRHSAPLLKHFDIRTPMQAYHDHSGDMKVASLLKRLEAGDSIALISDAGTPLISDPGYRLVERARDAGIRVVPIPGACAVIAALSAAGLPSDRFSFEGFPPAKRAARATFFRELNDVTRTLVFYESPHRIEESLDDLREAFGDDRPVVMARELTKTFETFVKGTAQEVLKVVRGDDNHKKGEIVLIVGGRRKDAIETLSGDHIHTMQILMAELPLKQAASLAAKITSQKKNAFYRWGLDQQAREGHE